MECAFWGGKRTAEALCLRGGAANRLCSQLNSLLLLTQVLLRQACRMRQRAPRILAEVRFPYLTHLHMGCARAAAPAGRRRRGARGPRSRRRRGARRSGCPGWRAESARAPACGTLGPPAHRGSPDQATQTAVRKWPTCLWAHRFKALDISDMQGLQVGMCPAVNDCLPPCSLPDHNTTNMAYP